MEKIIQDIFTFLYNLITDINFYFLLMAVAAAWLFAFIPQRRQNIQHTFFELLRNQNDILNRINGGINYFENSKERLIQFYNLISLIMIISDDGKYIIISEGSKMTVKKW